MNTITKKLERVGRWGIRWSLWPPHLVTACCGVEFGHAFGSVYDAERFGMLPMGSLRQSNIIIVEGTVTLKMAKYVKYVYEQMGYPKYVLAMGACAIKGGVFYGSYHMVSAASVVPVDGYISGCPPTPEALLRAVKELQEKIAGDRSDTKIVEEQWVLKEWPFGQKFGETFFIDSEEKILEGRRGMVLLVGPQHPGSGHMRIFVVIDGDVIVDVVPDPGFVHRGIEKLAENRPYWTLVPLVEKASIMDSMNITYPTVLALEKALGLEPPPRAKYLRVLMAELSRIRTHLYDMALLGIFLGHSTAFMWSFAIQDLFAEVFAKIAGARTTISYPVPGGVRRDISREQIESVEKLLNKVERKLKDFKTLFLDNPVTKARLEGVGVLNTKQITELGVVGPFARASGVDYDVRKVYPYDAYGDLDFDIVVEKSGDSLARAMVRWREIYVSIDIVRQILKSLPEGDVIDEALLFKNPEYRRSGVSGVLGVYTYMYPEPGEFSSMVETARGLAYIQLLTTGAQRLYRMRFVTPSWRNLRGMVEAMKGHRLADMPTVYMSFGYFPPEADR
ncbi:MAG: NADH-quinone oxidoreductase subunit D [Pyrobaculum sp.]